MRVLTYEGGKKVIKTVDPSEIDFAPAIDEREAMTCSPAQMRLVLLRANLLDQVQAIVDASPEASIVWEYATQIDRKSPLIDALGGANGFSPEQIDDLFRKAMETQI